ncbi:MAG: S8 family serine peptidase, partial [candidate division Zixibacteria bacterium]|nr:S8 family serine peptidase [candidate division Zixibacteria bacterium]
AMEAVRDQFPVVSERRLLDGLRSSASVETALGSVYLLTVEPGTDIEAMALAYSSLYEVEYAQPDYELELYDLPNDTLYDLQWGLNNTGQTLFLVDRIPGTANDTIMKINGVPDADIDALEVYETPPDNTTTVVVGIVDTGVDTDHPDLVGRLWSNPDEIAGNGIDDDHNGIVDDVNGANVVAGSGHPSDVHGHGTHCAGIVAATVGNGIGVAGVCPDARIMGVQCWPLTLSTVAVGVVYAAENGADVINMSWGAPWAMPVVYDALMCARAYGVVLIAAAGNDGFERVNYPASYPEVISVAATSWEDEIAEFSTYNEYLNVCAPGYSILSLRASGTDMYGDKGEPDVHIIDEDYYLASGTSMASPHVVGVAAYLRAVSPGLTHDYVRNVLETTADDYLDPFGLGENLPGWDIYSGYGRVNLQSALASGLPQVAASLTAPSRFAVVSGTVDITGTADGAAFGSYTLEYGEGERPQSWTLINSGTSPVTDNLLGSWSTAGLHGQYMIRLRVGEFNQACSPVYVLDGAVAEITEPADYQTLGGYAAIRGTAGCADFDHYTLSVGPGESPSSWSVFAQASDVVIGGHLGDWECAAYPDQRYGVKLDVYSTSGLEVSDTIVVEIQEVFAGDDGWSTQLGATPGISATYCDLDQDGDHEIIVGTSLGIKVLDTDGAIITEGIPAFPSGDYRIMPAVGHLDADEYEDMVIMNDTGLMTIYRSDSPPITTTVSEDPASVVTDVTSISSTPRLFLRDVNGDGIDEIHYFPGGFSERAGWYFVYNADGTPWECGFPPRVGLRNCLPADLDGDGIDEIYCYGDSLVQFDTCGNQMNAVALILDEYTMTSGHAGLSAVDIDFDGKSELIIHGSFSSSPWTHLGFYVYAFDENLVLMEGWPHGMDINGFFRPWHPIFGDLDGDGSLEYVTAFADLDVSFIYAWHLDGTPFLGTQSNSGFFVSTDHEGMCSMPLLVDIDGNRDPDIILPVEADIYPVDYDVERLLAYTAQATMVARFPMIVAQSGVGIGMHNVVAGDVNGDGDVDLLFATADDRVVFQNFPGVDYDSVAAFYPVFGYNRRLNFTAAPSPYADPDSDGVSNIQDNCPLESNPDQADRDVDDVGDACDNCADGPNPGQEDSNSDGIGDACFCEGMKGNVDCTDDVDIGDLTMMIDRLFISFEPVTCPLEANLVGEEPWMLDVSDLTMMIDHLFINMLPLPDCP